MGWFKRIKEGITTSTKEKKETPEGLWYKCPSCKKINTSTEHSNNKYVCNNCGHHERIGSSEYFEILFDENQFTELHENMISGDPLEFSDTKKYKERLVDSIKKSGLKDAIRAAYGKVNGNDLVVCCMDFNFIGGSMGSVVGEKISRSIDFCLKTRQEDAERLKELEIIRIQSENYINEDNTTGKLYGYYNCETNKVKKAPVEIEV
jgi:acetyl-CoA carboxylase carboxyl transferase subunit beta